MVLLKVSVDKGFYSIVGFLVYMDKWFIIWFEEDFVWSCLFLFEIREDKI